MEPSGGEVVATIGEGVKMKADDMYALASDVELVRRSSGKNPS